MAPDQAAEIANGTAGTCLATIPESGHSSTIQPREFVIQPLLESLQA